MQKNGPLLEFESIPCGIFWCAEGVFVTNGREQCVDAGQLITFEGSERVEINVVSDRAEIFYLIFDGAYSRGLLSEHGIWPSVFDFVENPQPSFQLILDAFDEGEKCEKIMVAAYSLLHLVAADIQKSSCDRMSFAVCKYFHQNWSKCSVNVAAVLEHFQIGRTKASKSFKHYTGMSMHDYLDDLRLKGAKHMLAHDKISVRDVAAKCGFSDAGYFATKFKSAYGMSPSEYPRK
jgi:AraC-like DNA-binding protein